MGSDRGSSGTKIRAHDPGSWYYIAGIIVLIFGSLHLLLLIPIKITILDDLGFSADPITGSVMIISSILLLVGGYRTVSGLEDSKGYIMVGWFIGVLLSSVSFLVLLSNTFRSVVLASDALSDWNVLDDIVPALYIGAVYFLLFPFIMKHWRKREKDNGNRGGGSP